MNQKTGTACRIRNAPLMRFGRLILLAMVWPSGLYLLLGGVEPFSGLFLLLAGIWLLLDNPLEFLAALSGSCPACGAEETEFVSGDELEIAYLEVEEHEPCAAGKESSQ